MINTAYIAFGSNQGDSLAILDMAKHEIGATEGIQMKKQSPVYRTKPLGVAGTQKDYINAVFEVDTTLDADSVLVELNRIEFRHGRRRAKIKNLARPLDLDLLLYGNLKKKSNALTLPHPRMYQRAFVLLPLYDLSPDIEIPGQGKVLTLLEAVRDQEVEQL